MNRVVCFVCLAALFLGAGDAAQGAFTNGNLIVLTTTKNSGTDANAITFNEYTFNPANPNLFDSSPTTHAIAGVTLPGEADHDGLLHLSTNGSSLVFGGYQAAVGTPGVIASASTRVIGTVDSSWSLTTTPITGYAGVALRSVVSTDSQHFWTGGDQGASGGQYYVDATGPVAQTLITSNDARANRIVDGQLWGFSSSNNGTTIGTGLPTSAAAATAAMTSPFVKSDAFFLDLDNSGTAETAYTTDGKNLLGKWHFDGTTWSLTGQFTGVKAAINDINSLQAFVYNGNVELLAATQLGQVFRFEDTNGINNNFSANILANTSPTPILTQAGASFRGMAIAVPEPSTLTLLALAIPFFAWRLRRKVR